MTRGTILLSILLLATLATVGRAGTDEGTTYGTVGADAKTVTVADLLTKPDDYVDTLVRVEGTVTDVCSRMGCWIDIAGDGERHVRFKVKDGEMVFPVEAKGRPVVAEGTFRRIEMTEKEAVGWASHLAEERGETFDPETDDAPTVIYRIQGAGAVIR